MIIIQAEPFNPGLELARFMDRAPGAGAIVSFTGLVRAESELGPVSKLELDHYPALTAKTLEAIREEAGARFDLDELVIIHRHGMLERGEPIVFVAAAAPHRRAAFEAADYVMDRLKTEAAFWKREHGRGGSTWIEASAADLEDRARWG